MNRPEKDWKPRPTKTDRIKIFGQSILNDLQTKTKGLETEIRQKKDRLECKRIMAKAGIISLMDLDGQHDDSPIIYVGPEMSWFAEEIIGLFFENQVQELEKELKNIKHATAIIEGKTGNDGYDINRARSFPIVELVEVYVNLKRVGSGKYRGRCPFHDDRSPSFFVFENRNRFKCFGCGASGDVIQFLMQIENIKFKQAVSALCILSRTDQL